jgi:hypothetical protein
MTSNLSATSLDTLVIVCLAFAALLILIGILTYPRLRHRLNLSRYQFAAGMAVLTITLVLAFVWLPAKGMTDDNIFLRWMGGISRQGAVVTYDATHGGKYGNTVGGSRDYPPLTYVIMDGAVRTGRALGLSNYLALKLTSALLVLVSCVILWEWTGSAAAVAALAALTLVEAMVYGYLDVWFTPTLLLALWALQKKRFALGVTLFFVSCFIKWQPLIIAPFVLAYVIWNDDAHRLLERIRWRKVWFSVVLPVALGVGVLFLFFGTTPLLSVQKATDNAPLSGQALNLDWVITTVLQRFDPRLFGSLNSPLVPILRTLDWRILLGPRLLFIAAYAASGVLFLIGPKTFERLVAFSLLGFLSYFMFYTGVHENHLYVPAVLGIVLWRLAPPRNQLALIWGLLCLVNIVAFYDPGGSHTAAQRLIAGIDITFPLAVLYVVFFGYFVFNEWGNLSLPRRAHIPTTDSPSPAVSP